MPIFPGCRKNSCGKIKKGKRKQNQGIFKSS